MYKKLISLSAQALIVLLVTFVLAEITIRIYKQFFPTFIFYDHSYNRFRGKPGAADYDFVLNSKGFKDIEFKREKEPGTYRILALGDSFAFGVVPYQYNYLTLLEERLNDSGARTEVINMGIPSIGPQDYLSLFANEGVMLQPDMVVVSFFVGNDFTETMRWRTKLHEFSDFIALLKFFIDLNGKFTGNVIHGQTSYDDTVPYFSDESYLQIESERSWMYLKELPFKKAFADKAYSDGVGYLVRIKELCDRQRIVLKVVIVPDELQVNQALQAKVIKSLNISPDEFDFALPNRFLSEQFKVNHIDHLDLLPAFSSTSAQLNLYKPNDTHWNIMGNRLAADLLVEYLLSQIMSSGSHDEVR